MSPARIKTRKIYGVSRGSFRARQADRICRKAQFRAQSPSRKTPQKSPRRIQHSPRIPFPLRRPSFCDVPHLLNIPIILAAVSESMSFSIFNICAISPSTVKSPRNKSRHLTGLCQNRIFQRPSSRAQQLAQQAPPIYPKIFHYHISRAKNALRGPIANVH